MIRKRLIFYMLTGCVFLGLAFSLLSQTEMASKAVEIYDLRSYTHPTHTRIVVDIGRLREYAPSELRELGSLYVDIFGALLNPILHGKTILVKTDYLSQIRIVQKTAATVRLTVDVDFSKIDHYRVWHLYDPFRVIVDIYPKGAAAAAPSSSAEKPPQPPEPTTSGYTMIRQLALGVKTVVIDPGHGGTDPGCISKTGLQEKDVALEVSLEVQRLLTANKSLEVTLTRETDIFVPLENRTVVANQKKADIYISIHVNSHPNKKRAGVETFYLNFSPDPRVNEIAARENATSTKNISQMQETIKKIVQNSKILESKELAEKIQKNLVKCLTQKYPHVQDQGVRGGPFWVLIGGEMPSILVEISHLSNFQEESRLKNPAYRKLIAQGIYEGIAEYMKSLGKG